MGVEYHEYNIKHHIIPLLVYCSVITDSYFQNINEDEYLNPHFTQIIQSTAGTNIRCDPSFNIAPNIRLC